MTKMTKSEGVRAKKAYKMAFDMETNAFVKKGRMPTDAEIEAMHAIVLFETSTIIAMERKLGRNLSKKETAIVLDQFSALSEHGRSAIAEEIKRIKRTKGKGADYAKA